MRVQSNLADRRTRRTATLCNRWLPLLAGLLLFVPAHGQARDERGAIQVSTAETKHGGTAWFLNAWMNITLSQKAREALENGVPLVFDFQIQTLEKHTWLWDRVIEEHREVRKIRYHPLSRAYIVKNANTGDLRGFRRLSEAMRSVGLLLDVKVLDYSAMDDTAHYAVRLRGGLDIESLPTPIRLLAYVSSAWNIKSDWYQWPLAR